MRNWAITPRRWGGEEFLVVSPATDIAGAAALGERIRAAVAAEVMSAEDTEQTVVTVSVGVAVGSDDVDSIVRNADAALYEAKSEGRNRVEIAAAT